MGATGPGLRWLGVRGARSTSVDEAESREGLLLLCDSHVDK